MDFDLIFDEFPTRIIPYDYDTYFASPERFVMVTSNCRTGEANYFEEKHDPVRLLNICRPLAVCLLFVRSLTWTRSPCWTGESVMPSRSGKQ